MSIYNNDFDFNEFIDKIKIPLIILGAIIALIVGYTIITGIGSSIQKVADSTAFSVSFDKNPVKVNEQAKMTVVIRNITDQDAKNVEVKVRAKDAKTIWIRPYTAQNNIINVLEKDGQRKIEFLVDPVGEQVLPGRYVVVTSASINGKEFKNETIIEVQK